jgi:lysophospholipase L1-like esterase
MSILQQFKNKENIHLLWDVFLDELNVNTNNKGMISNIKTVFESNIQPFTSRANPKAQIIELNKKLQLLTEMEEITFIDYHTAMRNETGALNPDFADDGVHPNTLGYKRMESVFEQIFTIS